MASFTVVYITKSGTKATTTENAKDEFEATEKVEKRIPGCTVATVERR